MRSDVKNTCLKKKYQEKSSIITWRFTFLFNCILVAIFFLLGRIMWLQIISPEILIHQGNMRSLRIQEISTFRGMITDRLGRLLAVNIPTKAIWIDPKELPNVEKITLDNRWKALTDILKISFDKIANFIRTNPKNRFIYLARQVNLDVADYIKKLKLPGIHLREESRRYYPTGEETAHLIGFTNIDNRGIEGFEKSFDKWLTGQAGERIVRKDIYGRIIENVSFVKSKMAHNFMMSIDKRLQSFAYREIKNAVAINKAESGSVVLVDVDTGEILAMANSPSYNPNNLTNTPKSFIRNRAITDIFEPGSTVKPMVIMAALQRGIVNKNSVLNTTPYTINGHIIKDVSYYDELSLTGILQKSSNVGISKLALAMPSSVLVDTYSRFGLGKSTNLGLIGEHRGLYPQKKYWSTIDRATFSFGYGLMVTPLQLARVYATIGSYGIYRPLSIIRVNSPIIGERVFPESIVRIVVHMMESVALPGGGGTKAAIKGYRIAIKTGTVKKIGKRGHYVNKYIAYTAGIAPASNPRFALVVIINDPRIGKYYGGTISAPVFSSIMSDVLHTMHIKPDAIKTNINKFMVKINGKS